MLDHKTWMTLAAEEYRRLLDVLRAVEPDQWHLQTDCTEWDVFAMASHLCGAAQSTASVPELLRRTFIGRRRYPRAMLIDSINQVQVVERRGRSPQSLVAELEEASVRGVRTRSRIPAALRALVLPIGAPIGTKPLGYLTDRIYTRDAWMHRIDLARALGAPLLVTPEQDGLLVADVVDEWAAIHGQPYELTLTGPAGLHRAAGAGGEVLQLDAIEFARTMSGRATATGLLGVQVPF